MKPTEPEEEDQDRTQHVEEQYIDVAEIGMGDIEFEHARQANIALAQRAVYFVNGGYWAFSLQREREHTEFVSGHLLAGDGSTYAILIRSGDENEGNGRTFYVAPHAALVEDLPRLVEETDFEFTDISNNELLEDLPDDLTEPFQDAPPDTAENEQDRAPGSIS